MKRFEASTYNENMIVLTNKEQLEQLYDIIESEEDFILEWKSDDGKELAEVIIANNISSKVKNGEVKLSSFSEEK